MRVREMTKQSSAEELAQFCNLSDAARTLGQALEWVIRIALWHKLEVRMPCIVERYTWDASQLERTDHIITAIYPEQLTALAFGESEEVRDEGESTKDGAYLVLRYRRISLPLGEVSRSILELGQCEVARAVREGALMSSHAKKDREPRGRTRQQEEAEKLAAFACMTAVRQNARGEATRILKLDAAKPARDIKMTAEYLAKCLRVVSDNAAGT